VISALKQHEDISLKTAEVYQTSVDNSGTVQQDLFPICQDNTAIKTL